MALRKRPCSRKAKPRHAGGAGNVWARDAYAGGAPRRPRHQPPNPTASEAGRGRRGPGLCTTPARRRRARPAEGLRPGRPPVLPRGLREGAAHGLRGARHAEARVDAIRGLVQGQVAPVATSARCTLALFMPRGFRAGVPKCCPAPATTPIRRRPSPSRLCRADAARHNRIRLTRACSPPLTQTLQARSLDAPPTCANLPAAGHEEQVAHAGGAFCHAFSLGRNRAE